MKHVTVLSFLLGSTLALPLGCESGRIKDPSEEDIVGSRRAGTATYDRLIQAATEELFATTAKKAVNAGDGPWRVAFAGVINKSAEDLGDMREAMNQSLETVVTNSELFVLVNQLFVRAALREIGVSRVDTLFLAKYRRQFVEQLEAEGQIPDYLIIATITTQTTDAAGVFTDTRDRVYNLSLDMVNAKSGVTVAKVMKKITKQYTK